MMDAPTFAHTVYYCIDYPYGHLVVFTGETPEQAARAWLESRRLRGASGVPRIYAETWPR